MKQNTASPDEKSGRVTKLLIIILILIILLLIAGVAACTSALGPPKTPSPTNGGVELVLDPNAVLPEPEKPSAQGVAIPGWGSITIPADTDEIAVDFYNPLENDGFCYLTFELRLIDDSEQGYEVLYTSGLIEPGMHVKTAKLSHGLTAGVYDAVIHVQPYRRDGNLTPTNNADMQTVLKAE